MRCASPAQATAVVVATYGEINKLKEKDVNEQ